MERKRKIIFLFSYFHIFSQFHIFSYFHIFPYFHIYFLHFLLCVSFSFDMHIILFKFRGFFKLVLEFIGQYVN